MFPLRKLYRLNHRARIIARYGWARVGGAEEDDQVRLKASWKRLQKREAEGGDVWLPIWLGAWQKGQETSKEAEGRKGSEIHVFRSMRLGEIIGRTESIENSGNEAQIRNKSIFRRRNVYRSESPLQRHQRMQLLEQPWSSGPPAGPNLKTEHRQ
jgi:hypothetical protein